MLELIELKRNDERPTEDAVQRKEVGHVVQQQVKTIAGLKCQLAQLFVCAFKEFAKTGFDTELSFLLLFD